MQLQHIRLDARPVSADLDVVILVAGEAKGLRFGREILESSESKFERAPCYVDHGAKADEGRPGGRSVRDLAGFVYGVRYDRLQAALTAKLHLYQTAAWLRELAREAGGAEQFGLSADLWARCDDGNVVSIDSVASVDVVMNPAAGGRFVVAGEPKGRGHVPDVGRGNTEPPTGATQEARLAKGPARGMAKPGEESDVGKLEHSQQAEVPGGAAPNAEPMAKAVQPSAAVPAIARVGGEPAPPVTHVPAPPPAWVSFAKEVVKLKLQVSQLPANACTAIEAQLGAEPDMKALDSLIATYRQAYSQAQAQSTIKGLGRVSGMVTPLDRLTLAFERLMGLPVETKHANAARLSGIREMYDLLTGDWDRHGVFHPERVSLANATVTTMAQITANVLNKILLKSFELRPQWWDRIAYQEDFPTMNDVKWIAVGGFSDLSTVAEGAAYTEKTWDDYYEASEFIKKGNYIGVTLEMIDRDDVSAMKSIPRRLGLAAYRTLSAAIAGLFTSPDYQGVVLSDGDELFKSGDEHSNYTTAALSAANWTAAIAKMFKSTEFHSAKRLGIRPRYCMIPIDLETMALSIFTSDIRPVATELWDNVLKRAADSVVVVPDWTDTTDWAAVADPNELEGVCVGYRYGRAPELFVADSGLMGSMFTNDELRVKVRFVYTVGIGNYRALQKSHQ